MTVYVGMDVHRKRSQVAIIDAAGAQQRNRNLANDPAKLIPVLGPLPPGTPVAFEAADGWGWLVDLLEELELEPHLVHPSRCTAIATAPNRARPGARDPPPSHPDSQAPPQVRQHPRAAANWDSLWSPENYLGSARTENFASSNGAVLDTRHGYAAPARLRLNHWALSGDWTVKRQTIVLNEAEGRIAYRFPARDLHLVMAPAAPGSPIRFRVHIDEQPPGTGHGVDVDDQGNGTVTQPRLYQLIRQPGPVAERTFEITFLAPGVQAYAFTFG